MDKINKTPFSFLSDNIDRSPRSRNKDLLPPAQDRESEEYSLHSADQRKKKLLLRQHQAGSGNPGPLDELKAAHGLGFLQSNASSGNAWRQEQDDSFGFAPLSSGKKKNASRLGSFAFHSGDSNFSAQYKRSINQMGMLPAQQEAPDIPEDIQRILVGGNAMRGNMPAGSKRLYSQSEVQPEQAMQGQDAGKRRKTGRQEREWQLSRVRFGEYEYDLPAQILTKNGQQVMLTEQQQTLLHAFASRPNQSLSAEQLGAILSPNQQILDRVVHQRLSYLRKFLGPDQQQFIQTMPIVNHHGTHRGSYEFCPDDVVEVDRRDNAILRQPDPAWTAEYGGFTFYLDQYCAINNTTGMPVALTSAEVKVFRLLYNRAIETENGKTASQRIAPEDVYAEVIPMINDGSDKQKRHVRHVIDALIETLNNKFHRGGLRDGLAKSGTSRSSGESGYRLPMKIRKTDKPLPAGEPPGRAARILALQDHEVNLVPLGNGLSYNPEKHRLERNRNEVVLNAYTNTSGRHIRMTDNLLNVIKVLAQQPDRALTAKGIHRIMAASRMQTPLNANSLRTRISYINRICLHNGEAEMIRFNEEKNAYELNT